VGHSGLLASDALHIAAELNIIITTRSALAFAIRAHCLVLRALGEVIFLSTILLEVLAALCLTASALVRRSTGRSFAQSSCMDRVIFRAFIGLICRGTKLLETVSAFLLAADRRAGSTRGSIAICSLMDFQFLGTLRHACC